MEELKNTIRQRADEVKGYQCKNLIAVLENPMDMKNIGAVIRNANALGVEKIYVVDGRKSLPEDWQEMRERKSLYKISVSASKWTFISKRSL
jgi:tRNA (guanosine-2'-O-)-methyltransferase